MVLKLGPSCPVDGAFYVCDESPIKFIGCCMTNPCDNGGVCDSKDLRTATFNRGSYDKVPPQSCSSSNGTKSWFTCQNNNIPFLGCCSENPCKPTGCPQDKLIPSRLSDNATEAAVFIEDHPTAAPSPPPVTTSSPAPVESSNKSLHPGIIAGIVVGALIVLALIVLLVCWKMGWRLRNKEEDSRVIADFPATYVNNALPDMGEAQSQYQSSNPHHSFSPDHFSPEAYNIKVMPGLAPKTSIRSSRTTQTMVQEDDDSRPVEGRGDQYLSGNTLAPTMVAGGGLSMRSVSQPTSPITSNTNAHRVSMMSAVSDSHGQYARVNNMMVDSPEPSPSFGLIPEVAGEQRDQRQQSPPPRPRSMSPPQQFQQPYYASRQSYQAVPSLPPAELPDAEPVNRPMQASQQQWQPYRPK
ncbi:hypothetical protein MCOR25_000248 [Pyricularia grisea]|uniref:Uncharacterized protein n=1 Tax=Pyricularia grisea TaxID=148305 RepID=A0A6P8BKI5_PYRGI|nr:uncharacterized protein PgNI_02257 [Pyricularia grisea]KAI6383328.1 hypothetical protein MCOR25_000248 [Pyricularia grisea]TLD17209.1 hypothetical protein PgNI_02257 [Pyricularia grisea]